MHDEVAWAAPHTLPQRPQFIESCVRSKPSSTVPSQLLSNAPSLSVFDQNIKIPTVHQWNLNIQRQLTRTIAMTIGYSGSQGVHLVHQNEDINVVGPENMSFNSSGCNCFTINPAAYGRVINPNYGNIRASNWYGQSNYHGLQFNLTQRD